MTRDRMASEDRRVPLPPCEGHPADEYGPMGETLYCDGSCMVAPTFHEAFGRTDDGYEEVES